VQFGAVQGVPTTGDVVAQSATAVPHGATAPSIRAQPRAVQSQVARDGV
jgi:hypothetical protein